MKQKSYRSFKNMFRHIIKKKKKYLEVLCTDHAKYFEEHKLATRVQAK